MATVDSKDLFICGTCKKQFCLLTEFLKHKGKCGRTLSLSISPSRHVQPSVYSSKGAPASRCIRLSGKKAQVLKPFETSTVHHEPVTARKTDPQKLNAFVSKQSSSLATSSAGLQFLFPHAILEHEPFKLSTLPSSQGLAMPSIKTVGQEANDGQSKSKLRYLLPKPIIRIKPKCDVLYSLQNSAVENPRVGAGSTVVQNLPAHPSNSTSSQGHVESLIEPNRSFDSSVDYSSNSESSDEAVGQNGNEIAVKDCRSMMIEERIRVASTKTCHYCGREFSRLAYLENHLRSHTGVKPFQCIICGRSFAQKSNAARHVDSHKDWPMEILSSFVYDPGNNFTLSSYTCPVCNKTFMRYQDYRGHMPVHNDKKVFVCPSSSVCRVEFSSISSLTDHLEVHPVVSYSCSFCKKCFCTLEDIASHQMEHSQSDPEGSNDDSSELGSRKSKRTKPKFSCPVCGLRYVKQDALKRHLAASTHNYPCTVCDATYLSDKSRRDHLRKFHDINDESRQCTVCSKVFKNKHNLGLHMRRHTGERLFRCAACSTSFSRRDVFLKHKRKHDPAKPFPCPFRRCGCSSEFSTEGILDTHLLWHGAREPFRCPLCVKEYVEKVKLSGHLRKLHPSYSGDPSFVSSCLTCQKDFNDYFQFLNHLCTERVLFKQKAAQDEVEYEVSRVRRAPSSPQLQEPDSERCSADEQTLEIFISIDKD